MLVGVVGLLNVSMYVFVSMILVSLHILLTSVTHCGLRCSIHYSIHYYEVYIISSKKHDAKSGDFITPFEKFRVG